jgi:hypothetical protein
LHDSRIGDVDGANLDRGQVVKGWMDRDGQLRERVYDVACSDGRAVTDEDRSEGVVGNTVDVASATYNNSIGEALIMAYWRDPDLDPNERALYYVRVL